MLDKCQDRKRWTIWILTLLKLCLATATHDFKCVKYTQMRTIWIKTYVDLANFSVICDLNFLVWRTTTAVNVVSTFSVNPCAAMTIYIYSLKQAFNQYKYHQIWSNSFFDAQLIQWFNIGDVYFFININIFRHLKLEIALEIPASNEWKIQYRQFGSGRQTQMSKTAIDVVSSFNVKTCPATPVYIRLQTDFKPNNMSLKCII